MQDREEMKTILSFQFLTNVTIPSHSHSQIHTQSLQKRYQRPSLPSQNSQLPLTRTGNLFVKACTQRSNPSITIPEIPLIPSRIERTAPTISYAKILEQVALSIEEISSTASKTNNLHLTVDFPPERSEQRSGTLVSRFENNLNFINKLATRLNPNTKAQTIGPNVEIRDNVNPQGGGEYITDDECMLGIRTMIEKGRYVTLLINAGVDASTLKQVSKYDEIQGGMVVLINCALDRVSWFAKIGFGKYIDMFIPLYYLKVIAPDGWLIKVGSMKWTAFINSIDGPVVVEQFEERPSIMDVESKIRLIRL